MQIMSSLAAQLKGTPLQLALGGEGTYIMQTPLNLGLNLAKARQQYFPCRQLFDKNRVQLYLEFVFHGKNGSVPPQ